HGGGRFDRGGWSQVAHRSLRRRLRICARLKRPCRRFLIGRRLSGSRSVGAASLRQPFTRKVATGKGDSRLGDSPRLRTRRIPRDGGTTPRACPTGGAAG